MRNSDIDILREAELAATSGGVLILVGVTMFGFGLLVGWTLGFKIFGRRKRGPR